MRFDTDYMRGKKSEEESLNDLNKIFKTNLIHDDNNLVTLIFILKMEKYLLN